MNSVILSVDQMREAERAAMDQGVSEWELMQRAGAGAAQWVSRMAAGRPVTVLCGPGNNGGDGYVIAELLRTAGNLVRVIAPIAPKTETAIKARDSFRGEIDTSGSLDNPVAVDCLFGYGLDRQVEGPFASLLEQLRSSDCNKIAIDVPSSVSSDDGNYLGPVLAYDLTVALGAWKRAHFLMPAAAQMGAKRLVPLGLPQAEPSAELSQRPRLKKPAPDAHKYTRGLIAVMEGAMPGAAILASVAAMQAGAGYVKLIGDQSHPAAPADLVIETGDLGGLLSDDRIGALLVGPGLGRSDDAREKVRHVLLCGKYCVLDADALHLLDPEMIADVDATKIVVTPHEGELDALCKAFDVTASDKFARVAELQKASGVTILAKGPDTVLAGSGKTVVFPRGTSWLSVAGSGDVLAGILTARLASQKDCLAASQEAVWLHHEAALRAGPAFSASNLTAHLGQAFGAFL